MIKDKIIQIKLENPSITLNEIKEKLKLECSISTISNYLKKANLIKPDFNGMTKLMYDSKMKPFGSMVLYVKLFKNIRIGDFQDDIYLILIKDIGNQFILPGFSTVKSSESITIFMDYFIEKVNSLNFNISDITTSKNRLYQQTDDGNNKTIFEFILENKYNIKHNSISNTEKVIDKFFKENADRIFDPAINYESYADLQSSLYASSYLINSEILETSKMTIKETSRIKQLFFNFLPIFIDDYFLDLNKIVESKEHWAKIIETEKCVKVRQKAVLLLENKGDKLPFDKKNKDIKLKYYHKALDLLCVDDSNIALQSALNIKIGMIYYQNGEGAETRKLYKKAVELALLSEDNTQIATAYYFYGDQLHQNGKRSLANDYYQKALDIFQGLNDTRRMCVVLGLLSSLMNDLKQYSKALNHTSKMLELSKAVNDQVQISIAYNKLANTYRNMKKIPEALNIYNDRLKFAQEVNDDYLICICYGNISNIYTDLQDYDNALVNLNLLFKTAVKIDHKILKAKGLSSIGNVYYQQKDYDLAIKNYTESLDLFKKLNIKSEIYNCLIKLGDLNKYKGCKLLAKNFYAKAIDAANKIGDRNLINQAVEKMKNRSVL